ncbi:hypothetical protein ACFC0M_02205 [Streptomyces sp. NPDC056149]|uniref:hypothetical protein n=1 Tax=Streptomyces sp. NPDC056149 TaxID=3345728 RepID=UPI0035DB9BD9
MVLAVTQVLMAHLKCPQAVATRQVIKSNGTENSSGGRTFTERYTEKIPDQLALALRGRCRPAISFAQRAATPACELFMLSVQRSAPQPKTVGGTDFRHAHHSARHLVDASRFTLTSSNRTKPNNY